MSLTPLARIVVRLIFMKIKEQFLGCHFNMNKVYGTYPFGRHAQKSFSVLAACFVFMLVICHCVLLSTSRNLIKHFSIFFPLLYSQFNIWTNLKTGKPAPPSPDQVMKLVSVFHLPAVAQVC